MTLRPSTRRVATAGARIGFVVSAAAFLLSMVGAFVAHPEPAAAATAGEAQIIAPLEDGGAPITGGGGGTPFSLALPSGASCTGDATASFALRSYLVPASVNPATLTFDSQGPVPLAYGSPQSAVRLPIYDTFGTPFTGFPSAALTPGGPGLVVNIPAFDFAGAGFSAGDIPDGDYNLGIACWRTSDSSLDHFWNAPIAVVADTADPSSVDIAWTVSEPATATTVALATDPAGTAAPGAEVELTATIEPAGAVGTVTFRDGAEALGDAVAVSGGSATMTASDLADGDHVLTAAFTPAAGSGFAPSTSAEVTLTIGQVSGSTTTTSPVAGSTTTTVFGSSVTTTFPSTVGGVTGSAPPLARTGGSLSLVVWAALMVIFGRMAILLGRKPTVRPARPG